MQEHDQQPRQERADLKTEMVLGIVLVGMILCPIGMAWLGSTLDPFRPVLAGAFTVFVVALLAIVLWRVWVWANTREPLLPRFQKKEHPHDETYDGYRGKR